jgi:hypothetical protein
MWKFLQYRRMPVKVVQSDFYEVDLGDAILNKCDDQNHLKINKVEYTWKSLKWKQSEEVFRNGGKAAAGALLGGALLGGAGLIAGAAMGGKRKKKLHKYAVLTVEYENDTFEITCELSQSDSKFLAMWFAGKY